LESDYADSAASYAGIADEIGGMEGRNLRSELWTVELLDNRLKKDPQDLMGGGN
jgi:hypothetical protein